jgi:hypothetical protein
VHAVNGSQMKERMGEHHYGEERVEAEEERAERLVREELKRLKWKEADLPVRPKGDRQKVKLALRLRAETAVTLKWIAQRLHTGTWTHLNHLLYWARHGK